MHKKNLDKNIEFLEKLQQHAQLQAELSSSRLLPSQMDWLSSRIGSYPWQTLVSLATVSTVLTVLWRHW